MKRLVFLTVILFAGVILGSAQQTDLLVYTSLEEPFARDLFRAFEREYPQIRVSYLRLSSLQAAARIEAEKAAPRASLWLGGPGLDHAMAKSKNLTVPFKPRVRIAIKEEFKDFQDYWIGFCVNPVIFGINLEWLRILKLPFPESWADLLRPEYKSYILLADPWRPGAAYQVITTIRTLYKGDEEAAFTYLKKLDANIYVYAYSGPPPGENTPIVIDFAHEQLLLRDQTGKVNIMVPREGTGYELSAMSLLRGGPEPIAARLFYTWIMSSRNAQRVINDWRYTPTVEGALRSPISLSLDQANLVPQDEIWDGANRKRLLERWANEIYSVRVTP